MGPWGTLSGHRGLPLPSHGMGGMMWCWLPPWALCIPVLSWTLD